MKDRVKAAVAGTALDRPLRELWRRVRSEPAPTVQGRQEIAYDEQLREVMRRVLRSDSNCVDAGAHRGKFLEPIVQHAPDGTHVAFEPIPDLAAELREQYPQVEIHEAALADTTGTAPFRVVPGDAAQCSGFERRPWDTYPEEDVELIDVAVVRLDDVLPADRPIRLIKIDVEGAELLLLRGATRTLTDWRPFVAWEHGGHDRDIFDLFESAGLAISLMDDWLSGRPPLNFSDFTDVRSVEWFFLAHPTT